MKEIQQNKIFSSNICRFGDYAIYNDADAHAQTFIKYNNGKWYSALNDKQNDNIIYYNAIIDVEKNAINAHIKSINPFKIFVCGLRIFDGSFNYVIKNPDFYIFKNNELIKLESGIKGVDSVSFPSKPIKRLNGDIDIEFKFYNKGGVELACNRIINDTGFLYPYGYENPIMNDQNNRPFVISDDFLRVYGIHDENNNVDHYDILKPYYESILTEKEDGHKIESIRIFHMNTLNYYVLCLKKRNGTCNAILCGEEYNENRLFYFKEWCKKLSFVETKNPLVEFKTQFIRAEYDNGKCYIAYEECVFNASLIYAMFPHYQYMGFLILDNDGKYHFYNGRTYNINKDIYYINNIHYAEIPDNKVTFDNLYYLDKGLNVIVKANEKFAAIRKGYDCPNTTIDIIIPEKIVISPQCPFDPDEEKKFQTGWYSDITYKRNANGLSMIFKIENKGVVTGINGYIIDYIIYNE